MEPAARSSTSAVLRHFLAVGSVCLLGLAFLSCDAIGDAIGGSDLPDSLVPLTVGNRWQATGNEGGEIESATFRILQTDAELRLVEPDDAIPYNMPIKKKSGGDLLVKWARTRGQVDGSIKLKYPADDGATYTYTEPQGQKRTFEISVSRDSVTVPVGTFDCFIYTVRDSQQTLAQASIKPGFGPVRVSLSDRGSVLELVDSNVTP